MQNPHNHGNQPNIDGHHQRHPSGSLSSLNPSVYGGMHHGVGAPMSLTTHYNTTSGSTDGMRYSDPMTDIMHTPSSHQSHGSHHSMASLSAQKRAYRQRRKDPSCDACRERKVKCDATDASSCSECTSRQVKCQFTKETNRRMSSMKQVQDLERQLHQAKQQISQMKGILQDSSTTNGSISTHLSSNLQDVAQPRDRGQPPRAASNFFKVRRNMRNYGRGVFKPPNAYRTTANRRLCTDDCPQLPARQVTDYLLAQFKVILHPYAPIVHWPTFLLEIDDLYRAATCKGFKKTWTAVFFAILACGTILSDERAHQEAGPLFIEHATKLTVTDEDDFGIDQARTSLLTSVYYMEVNKRSLSWIWLGSAIRAAEEAGLHIEMPNLSSMQQELRRRIWWSIYNWDRLCSLELGRFHDSIDPDIDVCEPTPIDDSLIKHDGYQKIEPGNSTPSSLLALIPAIRLTHQLQRTLKSRVISSQTLKIYDDHFRSIMDSYPEPYTLASLNPLDPLLINIVSTLQTCRFMLYRQNLTPICRPQEREDAVLRTVQVAKDTAHYIWRTTPTAFSRTQRTPVHPADTHNPEWRGRIKHSVSSFLIKHWWRCVLVLCHVGDFSQALTVVGAMAAVEARRKINIACGRYLLFYLDLLIQRWQAGRSAEIESDEEMIAYASGDLQGSNNAAWAWAGSGTPASLQSQESSGSSPGRGTNVGSPEQPFAQGDPTPSSGTNAPPPYLLTDHEEAHWGSWAQVEDMLHQLQHVQASSTSARPGSRSGSHYSSPDEARLPHPPTPGINQFPHNNVPSAGIPRPSLTNTSPSTVIHLPPAHIHSPQQQHQHSLQQLPPPAYHYSPPPQTGNYAPGPPSMPRPPSQPASHLGLTTALSPSTTSNSTTGNNASGGQAASSTGSSQTPVSRISISDIM